MKKLILKFSLEKKLMNIQVKEFYKTTQTREVLALHENQDISFAQAYKMAPLLPHGWFELVQLNVVDRIEFISGFWSSIFPYRPYVQDLIDRFFSEVDDIGVYLVKKDVESHFFPHLVYGMKDKENFYRGYPSASKEELKRLNEELELLLPEDYVCFMKIHNGFAKNGDYGLIPLHNIKREMVNLHSKVLNSGSKVLFQGKLLDPRCLIPFYKSIGDCVFQCFHKQWYPDKEMGNILFSLRDEGDFDYNSYLDQENKPIFPSFLDWLMCYMETLDV